MGTGLRKAKKERVPSRLYALRIRRGLSQGQIAQMVGISQVAYSKYERGWRCPAVDVALRIARVLRIPSKRLGRYFPGPDQAA